MKKFGLFIFAAALCVGLIFSTNCSFGGMRNFTGVQGSGVSKTETRSLKNFSKIDAGGAVNVEIAVQKDFSVAVQADDNLLANIKTEVDGDTLKIFSEDSITSKTPINVKISLPELERLALSGASSGTAANVKADSLELKASGASKIKIDGTAADLNVDASGASSVDAGNLKAANAEVDANGASSAIVSANEDLEATASGASKIIYVGEPKNIRQNSSGASSITKR